MSKKKDRVSPLFSNIQEQEETLTDHELDLQDGLEHLDRIEWDDNQQKDRELQKAFQDIEDAQINKVGVKYDSRTKLRAALAYATTGSSTQASKLTSVPSRTIRYWRQQAPWWPQAMKFALAAQKEGLDAKLGQIVDKALEGAMERMDLGDPVIIKDTYKDPDTGETLTKMRVEFAPIRGKELMVMASIARDKQAILRGEPTSISEKKTDKEVLDGITSRLAEALAGHNAPKSITGTYDKDGNRIDED